MGLFDRASAAEALEDLLDRERTAVVEGRFDVLERILSEKERLISTLAREGAPPDALVRLRKASERNSGLLTAMQTGVSAALRKVRAMREGAAPLQTYDAAGHKQACATRAGSLLRRA